MSVSRGDSVAVVANVRLTGADRTDPFADDPVDIHISDGLIVDIAPAGVLARRGAVLDGDGAWAIPGLWAHHVHTVQWALAAQRESLADASSPDQETRAAE